MRGEHADGRAHGGAQPRAPARCSFEPFSATEALDCLRGTDVVVTGNSVARGLHLELAAANGDARGGEEALPRRCPLPLGFGSMFRDNPQLFDHTKCTVQVPVANASLHFVWQTSFTSREISQFYRRLFSDQARSRRRLLLTTMALPNACAAWNGGAVGRNLSWAPNRVMPCLLKLLAQWPSHRDALAEAIAKLPAPSTWVVRTHPAIRTALPRITYQSELSDELAHLQRNVWMPLCLCTRRRKRFVRCTCSISSGRLSNRRRARGMRMPSIRGGSYNVGKRRLFCTSTADSVRALELRHNTVCRVRYCRFM